MKTYRKADRAKKPVDISVTFMIASCAILVLITLGGAWYVQVRQSAPVNDRNEHMVFCDPPRHGWSVLPMSMQLDLEQKCAAQATAEAK